MASPELGSRYCLRCGKPVGEEPSARQQTGSARQQPKSALGSAGSRHAATGRKDATLLRPSGYDGWETDEQLVHVARLLGESNEGESNDGDEPRDGAARCSGRKQHRFDAAHVSPDGHHSGRRSPRTATAESSLARRVVGALAAVSLMLGLMASTCGGVLLGWAVVMRRDDLWSVGLPIAVGGLLALLVSTVLQLDRLSGDHRQTVARLEGFNTYLHQIRRDAAEAKTLGPMTGDSLFSHWSGDASPQRFLDELRGRLDLLANRLGSAEDETCSSDSCSS